MRCSHTGHPFPHILLIFLTQENWSPTKRSLLHNLVRLSPPREDYHLTLTTLGDYHLPREDYQLSLTTLGDYHPLEKIITFHSLPWGIVSPSCL